MANSQRKVKPGFWVIVIFIAIMAFALIADWWKNNSAIGWTILAMLVIGIGFALYKYPSFRRAFIGKAKSTGKKIIYENEVPKREPVPSNIRTIVYNRSHSRCENPDCKANIQPHLHHIDNDYRNNSPRNLIALCPNCHGLAHKNEMSNSQLRNWVQRSWESYKRPK